MARRLVSLCAWIGLSMVGTASPAQSPTAPDDNNASDSNKASSLKRPSSPPNVSSWCSDEPPKQNPAKHQTSGADRHPEQRGSLQHKDAGHKDTDRSEGKDGPRGEGGRGSRNRGGRFLFEAMRRNGGTLEFLPLLLSPEIRQEIGIDDKEFQRKLERFTSEMQQNMDADRKVAEATPGTDLHKLLSERLAKENDRFEKFIDELPEDRRDRLIGIFVQMRNYRSLGNRMVSEKIGMSREESTALRKEINAIRDEIMSAARDSFKRIFEKGGDSAHFEKLVRENHEKIDARIKKKLTEAQLQNLQAVRGKEVDQALLRKIEMKPPALPPAQSAPTHDR